MRFKTLSKLLSVHSSLLSPRLLLNSCAIPRAMSTSSQASSVSTQSTSYADVHMFPMFDDNYGFILVDKKTSKSAVVDPGEGAAVKAALDELDINLDYILLTHKHADHVGGVEYLKRQYPDVTVIGTKHEEVPALDKPVGDGDSFTVGDLPINVVHVPCHTAGHIAFIVYPPVSAAYDHHSATGTKPPLLLFCGDTLFIGGCGRFFEGTPEEMLRNMDRLAALPPSTQVYCAHEYSETNLKFLASVEGTFVKEGDEAYASPTPIVQKLVQVRELRGAGQPTVPGTIGEEATYNLFMRCHHAETQKLVGAKDAVEAMRILRERKNNFRA